MKRWDAREAMRIAMRAGRPISLILDDLLSTAEEAGAKWDPEEEEMADELELGTRGGEPALFHRGDVTRPATSRELALAASLYNRRGAIETVARSLRLLSIQFVRPGAVYAVDGLDRLADRLEGK